jgi:AbrB family looped-hinge helix DNA binding protein
MRYTAKMTSKGQVTVPAHVRDALCVGPGDYLVFELKAEYATVSKRRSALEVMGELGERYPVCGSEVSGKAQAVADHFDDRAVAEDADQSRYGSELFVVGRGRARRADDE